ncbi:zinc finger BED domain-containing protein RICESLEEPER 2-like [Mangifera indica]|uniref:zinc finger BED domain-containing protein RICESLEEPER 2-like n=1 Tax=Mangifera indica TaxID=29780 RepID=UPI001CFAB2B9|nr:zinc finger BED domain-containing protein RICESLEEPER 2-like [Mangifera indica]
MHQKNISRGSSYLSTATGKKRSRSSRSVKGKGIAIQGSHLRDSVENQEVKTTFIEDYEKFEEDVGEREDIMSEGKSSSPSPPVIPPSKKKKTSVVWECFPEDMIITIGDVRFVVCKFCNKRLKLQKIHSTTYLCPHMGQCVERKKAMGKQSSSKGQMLLNFQPIEENCPGLLTPPIVRSNAKYNHDMIREALAHMILIDELPFSFDEHISFNYFCSILQPLYERIGRKQVKSDCDRVVQAEAKQLKKFFKELRKISVTTDLWKSDAQNIEYMVITAHWVDQEWTLNKRIINFVHVPPPRNGETIAQALYNCFEDWGIQNKVFTITVDNASMNDKCIKSLKKDFKMDRSLVSGGNLFHIRCTAHIINLLVQDGINEIKDIIDKVRDNVKYVRASEVRQRDFASIAKICRIKERKLVLDCPTRWNSTYNMLNVALIFREVWPRYGAKDGNYLQYLPNEIEWKKLARVCDFLRVFNNDKEFDPVVASMVRSMIVKFDKYWGEVNLLMAVAIVMDPRYKLEFIKFVYPVLYGEYDAEIELDNLRHTLEELYHEYVELLSTDNPSLAPISQMESSTSYDSDIVLQWQAHRKKSQAKAVEKSELTMYLESDVFEFETSEGAKTKKFNVLHWWSVNQTKFPILSRMAAEILAVSISTVASENAFSAGGRVIDSYRASLAPKTVSMLMCGGDWIRAKHRVKKSIQI